MARSIERGPFPVIWLTGQSGSGKTTLGKILARRMRAVLLDGDEMRESISLGATFTREDRTEHNHRVARLAAVLSRQVPVVVAVIAPYRTLRARIDKIVAPAWVYVRRELPKLKDRPYEEPRDAVYIVDSDEKTPATNARIVLDALGWRKHSVRAPKTPKKKGKKGRARSSQKGLDK